MHTVRIITLKRLHEFWQRHPDAEEPLRRWHEVAVEGEWKNLADVRATFPSTDLVSVATGNRVIVFNVAGNKFRLVTAIHFDRDCIFILRVMTHAQYDRPAWKKTL